MLDRSNRYCPGTITKRETGGLLRCGARDELRRSAGPRKLQTQTFEKEFGKRQIFRKR